MRIALLLSTPVSPDLEQMVAEDRHPRPDFVALAKELDAEIIAPLPEGWRPQDKRDKVWAYLKVAWAGFTRRNEFDVIVSDQDRIGELLGGLLKLSRSRQRHVMICHGKIAFGPDLRIARLIGLHSHIHHFVCYGPEIAERLWQALRISSERVSTVRHAADHSFWRPMNGTGQERVIVSAGMLDRDYPTLIEAVSGFDDLSVVVSGFSPWVAGDGFWTDSPPPNVTFTRRDYQGMRELYDQALFVAVPLQPTPSQSGSLVAYEAMAMGKPVVVTQTAGQKAMDIIRHGETGFYVEPGDVDGWRKAIRYLCENPDEARAMGQRARQAVEAGLNMDTYTATMRAVMQRMAQGLPGPVSEQSPQFDEPLG